MRAMPEVGTYPQMCADLTGEAEIPLRLFVFMKRLDDHHPADDDNIPL